MVTSPPPGSTEPSTDHGRRKTRPGEAGPGQTAPAAATPALPGPGPRDAGAGATPASGSRGAPPGACFVNSDVMGVVNLGISALPLPDGRVVLSSAPAVVVADRLATDAAIWRAS